MVAPQAPTSPWRCAAVATLASAALAAVVRWLLPIALTAPATELDDALARACAAAALVAIAALWLGAVALVLAAHGGRGEQVPRVSRVLPAPVRRLVLLACGVALSGTLAVSTAQAAPGHPHGDRDRLPLPDRAAVDRVHVVEPGDSLWSIAAATLPRGASDARVAQRWPRIYALNRDVIGPDPNLIQPAQRLTLPTR